MNKIYLDHSATTPVSAEVLDVMLPYFSNIYGNGSSQHSFGREALKAIDVARRQVADALGAKAGEIYFTSGGTESDNWAVRGVADAYKDKGKHIISTQIEHPAMIKTLQELEGKGYEVTYLSVDSEGFIDVEELEKSIRPDTILISVMAANNEIGTIEDISSIGKIAKAHNVLFHTDAVQAIGNLEIDVVKMNIDLLSLSAHKFYGPKGVGALYKRNGIKLGKFMTGGEQERAMRAGTLNTAGIVGLGKAIEVAVRDMKENNAKISAIRDYFVSEVDKRIPNVYYNGTRDNSKRLVSNANYSFEFIEGESLLLRLDLSGIAVSSGSACSSGSLEPSYVLLATGRAIELAHGSLRFSFGKDNTKEEVDYVIEKLVETVDRLRELSPLFKSIKGEDIYV